MPLMRLLRPYYLHIAFGILLLIFLYLRFWNIENTMEYGWDQARDAWKVRDILSGTVVFDGPRRTIWEYFGQHRQFCYLFLDYQEDLWSQIRAPFDIHLHGKRRAYRDG